MSNACIDGDRRQPRYDQESVQKANLVLVTWNVDSTSPSPASRISAIISNIATLAPAIDIIFFQEVSREGLRFLLEDPHIRQFWYSSEADEVNWLGQSFASMTLLSKRCFVHSNGPSGVAKPRLGPVWRLKYPSRFGRDALCCDIFLPSPARLSSSPVGTSYVRVRLVNVHLDSLPIQPSRRPQQIAAVASTLQSANRGLVAGDFNPVLAEDATLISDNHLVDVWLEHHPTESGYTWGVDGQQPFPPGRLDKVALFGLQSRSIEVMHPDVIKRSLQGGESALDSPGVTEDARPLQQGEETVSWSDHSGLRCSFGLISE